MFLLLTHVLYLNVYADSTNSQTAPLLKQLEPLTTEISKQPEGFQKAMALAEKYKRQNVYHYSYEDYTKQRLGPGGACNEIKDDLKRQECTKTTNELWDKKAEECLTLKMLSESSNCFLKINKERNTKLASNLETYQREVAPIPLIEAISLCSKIKSQELLEVCNLNVAGIAGNAAVIKNGKIKWYLIEGKWRDIHWVCDTLPIQDINIFKICLYGHSVLLSDKNGSPAVYKGIAISADNSIATNLNFKNTFCDFAKNHTIPEENFWKLRNKFCADLGPPMLHHSTWRSCGKVSPLDDQSKINLTAKCNLLSDDPLEQQNGVETLLKNPDSESIKILHDYLLKFSPLDEKAASLAIKGLSSLDDPGLERTLVEMLKQFDRPIAMPVAIEGISNLKDNQKARDILEKYAELDEINVLGPQLNALIQKEYDYEQSWKDPDDPLKFKFHRKIYSLQFQDNALTAKADSLTISGICNNRIKHFSEWTFRVGDQGDGFEIIFNEKLKVIISRKNNTDAGGPFLAAVSPDSKLIVFDYGTGPGGRDLEIRDDIGKLILSDSYIGDYGWTKKGFEYGQPNEIPENDWKSIKDCSEYETPWRVIHYIFDGTAKKKSGIKDTIACGP